MTPRLERQKNVRKFTFTIHYFKDTGKWYTSTEYEYAVEAIGEGSREHPYMNTVIAHIRGLRDNGGQGALAGLSEYTEGWPGYIYVQWRDSFPCLILPRKETS